MKRTPGSRRFTFSAAAAFVLVPALLSAQQPATWRLTPEQRLGDGKQEAPYLFSRIKAIVPAPDGRLYVAHSQSDEIRVYDANGTYQRLIGRHGHGPGEFEMLQDIGLLGDTLWAVDSSLRRASLFSLDGRLLETIRPAVPASSTSALRAVFTAMLPGGRALGTAYQAMTPPAQPDWNAPTQVVLLSRAGAIIDTVAAVANTRSTVFNNGDGSFLILTQPFRDSPLTILAPSTGRLFVVDRTVTETPRNAVFRVTAIQASGDTLWNRAYAYTPRPLEQASADSVRSRFRRGSRDRSPEELQRAVFIPDFRTPISSGFAGPDGTLWLRREHGAATAEYWVLRADGTHIATLTVPGNVTLRTATATKVWGVEIGEYDEPSIVRYSIAK